VAGVAGALCLPATQSHLISSLYACFSQKQNTSKTDKQKSAKRNNATQNQNININVLSSIFTLAFFTALAYCVRLWL
jgi:hypothetical protein